MNFVKNLRMKLIRWLMPPAPPAATQLAVCKLRSTPPNSVHLQLWDTGPVVNVFYFPNGRGHACEMDGFSFRKGQDDLAVQEVLFVKSQIVPVPWKVP
jgi:hypothetical protein